VLKLPLCVTKQMKLVKGLSANVMAVPVKVTKVDPTEDPTEAESEDETTEKAGVTFYASPEFMAPNMKTLRRNGSQSRPKSAEQRAAKAVEADIAAEDVPELDWDNQHPGITMHPFWAVRRQTESQLQSARSKAKVDRARDSSMMLPRFNCKIQMYSITTVTVGDVGGRSCNVSRMCRVPVLTNLFSLENGEELILEIHEKKQSPQKEKKRDWKVAFAEKEKAKASAKAKTKTSAKHAP